MATRTVKVNGKHVEVDLDGPFVDIVDDLFYAGMDSEDAEDLAWKLVQ